MSRSVNYLNNASAVAFIPTTDFAGVEDEEDTSYLWDEAVEDLKARLVERWPSFYEVEEWDNRETLVVAKNEHAIVGVSEYCGLTSISIAVRENTEYPGLAERWVDSIAAAFTKNFGSLVKMGTFSNGESVYQKAG